MEYELRKMLHDIIENQRELIRKVQLMDMQIQSD